MVFNDIQLSRMLNNDEYIAEWDDQSTFFEHNCISIIVILLNKITIQIAFKTFLSSDYKLFLQYIDISHC